MPDAMRIRVAQPGDESAVRACVVAAYSHYVDRMGTAPAPMLDDYRQLIAAGRVRVAVANDHLVGLMVLWSKGDHLYIDNLAVDPTSQGVGVGGRLLAAAEREAGHAGLPEIRLYTNEAMTENLDYYPRRGFAETHRGIEAGYRRVYFSLSVSTPS